MRTGLKNIVLSSVSGQNDLVINHRLNRLLLNRRVINSIIFVLFPLFLNGAVPAYLRKGFKHLSVENGLSQNSVFSIFKDRSNFMWFGTRRGLNRFDGISFKYYIHNPNDSTSISSNQIQSIISDRYDNLLIQTDRGINYYDRFKEIFFKVRFNQKISNFVADNQNQIWGVCDTGLVKFFSRDKRIDIVRRDSVFCNLFDIAYDGKECLWITNPHGVICYNISTFRYKFYSLPKSIKNAVDDYFIEIVNGRTWVCAGNMLFKYDAQTDLFTSYKNDKVLDNLIISSFCSGFNDNLLIGTDGNGLLQLNTLTNEWDTFNHIPDDNKSLSGNTVYSLYTDNKLGIVWVGQYMAGIDYSTVYSNGFSFLYHQPNNSKGILNNNVRCLLTDLDQNIWIGTRQGISIYSPESGETTNLNEATLLRAGLSNSIITKLWMGPDGYVWICAYKGGIVCYHPKKKCFAKPETIYPKFKLPNDVGVFDMLLDSNNNLWVATGTGTFLFPQNKNGFKFHGDFAKCLIEDRAGRIFIGTVSTGVIGVNTASLHIINTSINSLLSGVDSRRVNSLFEDSQGNIWIGTGGGGVYCYNPNTDKEIEYHAGFGLFDKYVAAITEDSNHVIWITTYSGLVKFTPRSKTFKNIYLEEGIKGKEFNPNSITQTNKGLIFAGTTNGLLYFEPTLYRENTFIPDVIFTDFFINNQRFTIDKSGSLTDTAIEFNRTITLASNQNTVGIEYTAPDYYFGDKINFFYKIKEISKDWISLGNRRYLDFFKLDPGTYTISIKAENSDGLIAQTGTSLTLIIKKPLWKTNLAILVYLIMIILAVFFIRNALKARLRLKYQVFLEKADKAKQLEINRTRLKFFSDISHEIGTFLTLISLPIETLNKIEEDSTKKYYLELVNKNLKRLQLLVNRIVHLRKIESGSVGLIAEKDNVTNFVKSFCESFTPLIAEKGIKLSYDIPQDPVICWFDKEKIEHIIYNLLSNAVKFTPPHGQIIVGIRKGPGSVNGYSGKVVELIIFNSGSKISPDNKIFDQLLKDKEDHFSSGMGLQLAKQYAELHKGDITFISIPDKGVTFTVIIPYGESYLAEHEKTATNAGYKFSTLQYIEGEKDIQPQLLENKDNKDKNLILYIEKNSDLRNFLISKLTDDFRFIESNDIDDGILKAKNLQPQLILSDINLANSESLDFCKQVKNDIDISHIPLVVLTLQENIEEQIEGLKAGADAYVTKPISIEYLISVINNQIESRKKLKLAFHTSDDLPDPTEFSALDQKFLKRVYKILEDNLSNSNLGIPEFIKAMGTSKYMLYSKLAMLTGQTPNELIINYRLKKAASLLRNSHKKDVDVYMELGFNDLSYFRKCFKKQFGVTPSQFSRSQVIGT